MKRQKKKSQVNSKKVVESPPEESCGTANGPSGGWLKLFLISLLGSTLLWLSFAPVGIWPLAWFAITPWCWLVEREQFRCRRPYLAIWLAGFLYWLATIYFLPIPHPALWLGWIVFSLYLSVFLPLFIGVSRVLTRQFRVPAMLAIPIIWTGVEFIRSNYGVEFGTILLGHTQFKFPLLIQMADLFGMYTVSFLMALFSICIVRIWSSMGSISRAALPALVAIAVVGTMVGYGYWKLGQVRADPDSPVVRLALIQGSIDTEFPATSEEAGKLIKSQVTQYRDLTWQARATARDLDLIIWPETIFLSGYTIPDPNESKLSRDERTLIQGDRDNFRYFWEGSTGLRPFGEVDPPRGLTPIALMTGVGATNPVTGESYNSAVLIEPDGKVSAHYDKKHLVIIGEYIPFAAWFPILKKLSPNGSIGRGDGPKNFAYGGLNFAPNICFESTVPHLIRGYVNRIADEGTEPDVLVNLTNDGWFFGTACLDHHLACNVFRAVEMRKPMLVCANTGFSAVIDSGGQMKSQGPRRDVGILYANAARDVPQYSLYRQYGDVLPLGCGVVCLVALLAGWWQRRKGLAGRTD
jgi:apolipoprotein N-acyltransferase